MSRAFVKEPDEDEAEGKVSWVSPLARAVAGARVGDSVVWRRPAGEVELTIVAIR
jgi:transcription elongation GreA/GreB family factor